MEVTATIKQSGKDMPWLVYRGSVDEVKAAIVESFTMTPEDDADLSTIVTDAHVMFQAVGNAAVGLGARTAGIGNSKSSGAFQQARGGGGGETAAAAPAEPERSPLFNDIEKAQTVAELKALWTGNKAAFSDDELKAAYAAKGKALTAAGK